MHGCHTGQQLDFLLNREEELSCFWCWAPHFLGFVGLQVFLGYVGRRVYFGLCDYIGVLEKWGWDWEGGLINASEIGQTNQPKQIVHFAVPLATNNGIILNIFKIIDTFHFSLVLLQCGIIQ